MVIYSLDADEVTAYSVSQRLSNVTTTYTGNSVEASAEFTATLAAAEGYEMENVIVMMGGVDITSTAYDDSTGVITIASATGNIEIIATAVTEGA